MSTTPIRTIAAPDLSGYLRLQNEANKTITNSFNQLGQAGNSYNKVQSDLYNNPLLDRLKRSNSLEDFNAIDSSIDPNKANAAVQALQYGKVAEYNGIANKIADLKLMDQFNKNAPNYVSNIQDNLATNNYDPRQELALRDKLSAGINKDRNLDKLKTDANIIRDAQRSYNDGTLSNFVANSATNADQFNAINALLNKQQGTNASNENIIEDSEYISKINTAIADKDLEALYDMKSNIVSGNPNKPINKNLLNTIISAEKSILNYKKLIGEPVTPSYVPSSTNGSPPRQTDSLETQSKRLEAGELVNILDTERAQAEQIANIGRAPINIEQVKTENPDLVQGVSNQVVQNNQREIVNNPLLGLDEPAVNESSVLNLEVPNKLLQKINENRIIAQNKAFNAKDEFEGRNILNALKDGTENLINKGYAQSIADKSVSKDDVEYFLDNSPKVKDLPKITKDSIRNQANELLKGRPVQSNVDSERTKRLKTDANTKYDQVLRALNPSSNIQKYRSYKSVETQLRPLDDTAMTNKALEILNEGKSTDKTIFGGEKLSPQLLNTLYNDVKSKISSNPAIKNANRSQIYSSIINTAENVEGSVFNAAWFLTTPFKSRQNILDTTVTDVDKIVDDLIANTSLSEESNKTVRDEKRLSNTEATVKTLKEKSDKQISVLDTLIRLNANPGEIEKQEKKVIDSTNALSKYINSTKSNSNTNINITLKNSIPGVINTRPPLSKKDQVKDIKLMKNNRLIDLLRQQDNKTNR